MIPIDTDPSNATVDCLILVKRLASEPDMIARMAWRALEDFVDEAKANDFPIPKELRHPPIEMLANHGMSGAISLTSIVLATALDRGGLSCAIVDDDDLFEKYGDLATRELRRARVIAVSTTYITSRFELEEFLAQIRTAAPDIPIILGGQGLMALRLNPLTEPEPTLFDGVAAIVMGEADELIAPLVGFFSQGRPRPELPGILYKDGLSWHGSDKPASVELDHVPIPDYSLIDKCRINADRFDRSLYRPQFPSLEEGRGCVFKCRFCSYHTYSAFRRKSPQRIVDEMAAMKRQGFTGVSFVGAEFIAPIKHSRSVFEAIRDSGLNMTLWMYARLDLLSRHTDLLDLMVDAGVSDITFGMESGDESILMEMKKYYNVGEMVQGAKLAKQKGIKVTASFILGYPGETEKTISNTLDALTASNFDFVFLHPLGIVRDTPLWNLREKYGITMTESGLWSHKTMSLHQLPQHIQYVMRRLIEGTDSLFVNILRNHAPGFVNPGAVDYNQRLEEATRVLQRILLAEWTEGTTQEAKRRIWQELCVTANQLPARIIKRLSPQAAV
ncbi:MAG: radical SAM protein [Alphaproteobacteria bacterium]|nr:radical SAM protein [Alphaproteobacteria bacterium]